jgi:hypothetical protein
VCATPDDRLLDSFRILDGTLKQGRYALDGPLRLHDNRWIRRHVHSCGALAEDIHSKIAAGMVKILYLHELTSSMSNHLTMPHQLHPEKKRTISNKSLLELSILTTLPKDEECSSTSSAAEKDTNSEGSLHAWLTVIGSSLIYFASFGVINSFGFFQAYYEKNLLIGVPASTISFVGTIQLTLMNLLAAPAGSLFDCYGFKVCHYSSRLMHKPKQCRSSTPSPA